MLCRNVPDGKNDAQYLLLFGLYALCAVLFVCILAFFLRLVACLVACFSSFLFAACVLCCLFFAALGVGVSLGLAAFAVILAFLLCFVALCLCITLLLCCGLCIYDNRTGYDIIVLAILRRKLPRQGIFTGSQCFDLADNFRQTLGVVSAEDQL